MPRAKTLAAAAASPSGLVAYEPACCWLSKRCKPGPRLPRLDKWDGPRWLIVEAILTVSSGRVRAWPDPARGDWVSVVRRARLIAVAVRGM